MLHARLASLVLLWSLVAVLPGRAHALPPGFAERGFREGANHHLGDDSFVAAFGRLPRPGDSEALRMHTHLAFVRAWLAARPATRPELSARRQAILGYLDDYIAHGTTPTNAHRPWRNPVFIDDDGHICAVGYLIERTAGRALAERVAERYRYAYLEDITMPEVARWVAESGFTLEELASIQPGYAELVVDRFDFWDQQEPGEDGSEAPPRDGRWTVTSDRITFDGTWSRGTMDGHWTTWRSIASDDDRDKVVEVGSGDFHRGAGTWESRFSNGALMARGPFVNGRAHGAWTLWFPSGRVAAEGAFVRGERDGAWRFYYDDLPGTLLATGAFRVGRSAGPWRYFDARGVELARFDKSGTSIALADGASLERDWQSAPRATVARVFGSDADPEGYGSVLDRLTVNGVPTYVWFFLDRAVVLDVQGRRYHHEEEGWYRADCRWPAWRATRTGAVSLATLNRWLMAHPICDAPRRPADLDEQVALDRVIQTTSQPQAQRPSFACAYDDPFALPDSLVPCGDEADDETAPYEADDYLVRQRVGVSGGLAEQLFKYTHAFVDGRFAELYDTLPDRFDTDDPPSLVFPAR